MDSPSPADERQEHSVRGEEEIGVHQPRVSIIISDRSGYASGTCDLEPEDLDRTDDELIQRFVIPAALFALENFRRRTVAK